MIKIISLVFGLVMLLHVVRPLGLPGLRRRGDVWKIAVGALAIIMIVAVVKPN